jgi:hypothetical protein
LSIQPQQPALRETVHLTAPALSTGDYDTSLTLLSMSGNVITVTLQPPAVQTTAPPPALDVVLGQFPTGSYDVNVQIVNPASGATTAVGSAHFAVAAAKITNPPGPLYDFTDLWWTPTESGWGLTVIQHSDGALFAAWFVYGSDGKPIWYVIPGGTWLGSQFKGSVYKTTGPYFGGAFDPTKGVVSLAGTAELNFTDFNHAFFNYTIDGITSGKDIQREPF